MIFPAWKSGSGSREKWVSPCHRKAGGLGSLRPSAPVWAQRVVLEMGPGTGRLGLPSPLGAPTSRWRPLGARDARMVGPRTTGLEGWRAPPGPRPGFQTGGRTWGDQFERVAKLGHQGKSYFGSTLAGTVKDTERRESSCTAGGTANWRTGWGLFRKVKPGAS